MNELESMVIRLLGDGKSYEQMINKAMGDTTKLNQSIAGNTSQLSGLTNQLTAFGERAQGILGMLAGGLGIGSFIGTVQSAISKAADTEQIEIAFKSLIGNVETAQKTLNDLRQFAISTPFELPQILEAAKSMLAYGQTAETIVPTMQKLGDVASALNIPLSSLTYLYGTLKSSGRVMTVDMRQFANRGIPIWLELAKVIGMVSKDTRELTGAQSAQLQQMVSKGKVTFEMIEKSFASMTGEGGRFFKMMEEQSYSFNGIISNLKDSLGLLLADIGKQIIEGFDLKRVVGEVRDFATWAANSFKNMDPAMKKMLFTISGVVAGIGLLVAGFLALKGIILVVGSIISTVGLPFLAVVALIVAAVAAWVNKVGGIGKAIDIAKAKFLEFWKTIEPIRRALGELGMGLWKTFERVFSLITDTATKTWNAITGEGEVDWKKIAESTADMVTRIEYEVLRMEKAYYDAFVYIGKQAGLWLAMVEYDVRRISVLLDYEEKRIQRMSTLFGGGAFGVFGAFGAGRKRPELPKELQDLPDTFEEFLAMRKKMRLEGNDILDEKAKEDFKKKMEEAGQEGGKKLAKGIKDGLGDAFLYGSSEFERMLAKQLNMINQTGMPLPAAGAGGLLKNPHMGDPTVASSAIAPDSDWGHTLEEIRDALLEQQRKPVIKIEGAEATLG